MRRQESYWIVTDVVSECAEISVRSSMDEDAEVLAIISINPDAEDVALPENVNYISEAQILQFIMQMLRN